MKTRYARRLAALIVILAFLAILAIFAVSITQPIERFTLVQNRIKWTLQRASNYDYQAELICNCTEHDAPTPVQVRSGKSLNGKSRLYTVEGLFEIIEDALDQNAQSVIVTYDAAYGLPTRIEIDRSLKETGDEIAYQVTDFVLR